MAIKNERSHNDILDNNWYLHCTLVQIGILNGGYHWILLSLKDANKIVSVEMIFLEIQNLHRKMARNNFIVDLLLENQHRIGTWLMANGHFVQIILELIAEADSI